MRNRGHRIKHDTRDAGATTRPGSVPWTASYARRISSRRSHSLRAMPAPVERIFYAFQSGVVTHTSRLQLRVPHPRRRLPCVPSSAPTSSRGRDRSSCGRRQRGAGRWTRRRGLGRAPSAARATIALLLPCRSPRNLPIWGTVAAVEVRRYICPGLRHLASTAYRPLPASGVKGRNMYACLL